MTDADPNLEPEPVGLARRQLRTHRWIVMCAAVGFWPLLIVSAAYGGALGFGAYLAVVVVGLLLWALTGWTKTIKEAQALVEAYEGRRLEAAVNMSLDPPAPTPARPSLPAEHPLHAVAARLQALTDDPELGPVVDGLVAQLTRLEADQAALGPTMEALEAQDPRRERMHAVLQETETAHAAVVASLRDLLVELTARFDEDHEVLLSQAGDLLARLSAEAEVSATVAASSSQAVEGSAAAQARAAAAAQTRLRGGGG